MNDLSLYNASIRGIPMPPHIQKLPVSPKGFAVPWFVAWVDGVPDFRIVGPNKIATAHKHKLCWICGERLGRNFAMTLGPMCIINRTISEPPSHRDCAIYAAKACPFLSNPRMRRNTVGISDAAYGGAGEGIERNPGVVAVWITRSYRPFKAFNGVLFTFDDPDEVHWFAEGRTALRSEVEASINSGIHFLEDAASAEGPSALADLSRMTAKARQYLPADLS